MTTYSIQTQRGLSNLMAHHQWLLTSAVGLHVCSHSIFFVILKHAFGLSTKGDYCQTRSDGKLCSTSWLRAKTKVHEVLIRDMLCTDDAALVSHTEEKL